MLQTRQISIFNRILKSEDKISIHDLANFFEISEKTVINDIKCINDYVKEHYHLIVKNKRGYGLYIEGKQEDLEKVEDHFQHRLLDNYDITSRKSDDFKMLMTYIFNCNGYIRIDDIQLYLHTNRRTINNLLKEAKEELALYNINLITKPHYGMYIDGDEIAIRCCYVDNAYNSIKEYQSISDQDVIMNLTIDSFKNLYDKCYKYIQDNDIDMHNTALIKMVIFIMVNKIRTDLGFNYAYDEYQLMIYDKLCEVYDLSGFNIKMNDNDERLIKLYIYASLENNCDDIYQICKEDNDILLKKVFNKLYEYGIVSKANEDIMTSDLKKVVAKINIRKLFNIYEYAVDPSVKRIVRRSPLTCRIARVVNDEIIRYSNINLGTSVYIKLALAIHACIRKTRNIRKMNSIAVLTPIEKAYGDSLRRRILDRYSNIIKNIEVITLKDLNHLERFNYLIYSGNFMLDTINVDIPKLQVDYYFTESDVRNFYEHVVVPSRIYSKAFAKVESNDFISNYDFVSISKLKEDIMIYAKDDSIIKQINNYVIDEYSIFDETMNIVLFTRNSKKMFSKLILLNKKAYVGKLKFRRIFVYCIKLDGDMIKMKTSEKLLRNMMTIEDTDEIVIPKKLDFYDYYIYYKQREV